MHNENVLRTRELASRLSGSLKPSGSVPSAVPRRGQKEYQRATQLAFAAILQHESRAFVEEQAEGPEKWPVDGGGSNESA